MFGSIASCDASVQSDRIGIGIVSHDFSLSIGFDIAVPGGYSNKVELLGALIAGYLVRSDTTIFVDNKSSVDEMNMIVESLDHGLKHVGKRIINRVSNNEIRFRWKSRRSIDIMRNADNLAKRAYFPYNAIRAMINRMELPLPSENEIRNYLTTYSWY